MTGFQDAPDEAIEADEAKEACSSLVNKIKLCDKKREHYCNKIAIANLAIDGLQFIPWCKFSSTWV